MKLIFFVLRKNGHLKAGSLWNTLESLSFKSTGGEKRIPVQSLNALITHARRHPGSPAERPRFPGWLWGSESMSMRPFEHVGPYGPGCGSPCAPHFLECQCPAL